MMNRIYAYIFLIFAALTPVLLPAQNIDPTVEVSKVYEGTLTDVHKPALEMTVPDSVRTFALDFDYSVFDNPYRGSYEFNPYLMSMRPASVAVAPQRFYLRAGAGYRLYPELDMIWSPAFRKGFRMDVYASHHSYVGDYRRITSDPESAVQVLDEADRNQRWNGYDLSSNAGISGSLSWDGGSFGFDAGYVGLAGKNEFRTRGYDGVNVSLNVSSDKQPERSFIYDVSLEYRFAEDKVRYPEARECLSGHLFSLDAELGPVFRKAHRLLFSAGVDLFSYSVFPETLAAGFHLTPHYFLRKGRWLLDAGVRIDAVAARDFSFYHDAASRQQIFYPQVRIGFDLLKDAMNLYVEATGGNTLNTYGKYVSGNHYADFCNYGPVAVFGVDVERIRAVFGIQGRISSVFSYNLKGGYVNYADAALDGLSAASMCPTLGYAGFEQAFASVEWRWLSERVRFDGILCYSHSWNFERAEYLFRPASLTGDVSVEYNWRKRIYAGVGCDFSTSRSLALLPEGAAFSSVTIPGYADLNVSAEYALNRKISFWLRGGNLLCMTVQRTPFYAEGGINFTAGICLNL